MVDFCSRTGSRILLFLVSSALFAAGAHSQKLPDSIKLLKPPLISIDPATNSGSALLHLTNTSATPSPVLLSVGPLTSKQTKRVLEAGVSLSLPDGVSSGLVFHPNDLLAKDQLLILKVSLSNVWEAGESEAPLFNGSTEIGKLTAIKYRLPLNIHLEPKVEGIAPLSFSRGEEHTLILKNDDGMTYPIHWRLAIGTSRPSEGNLTLDPNSSGTIRIKPPADWFQSLFGGLFRSEVRDGVLTLRYEPRGTTGDSAPPSREIPVRASLGYWGEFATTCWSTSLLLLILLLGAATSFMLNYWIPNQLRLLTLKERLTSLAIKTRNLSTRIGSYLRVALRVERRRLEETLNKRMTLSPDFADTAQQAGRAIELLDQRIDLLEEIDSLYNTLSSAAAAGLSPTFCERIHRKIAESQEKLSKPNPQDADLQAAGSLKQDAASLLQITQIDEPTLQELRNRFIPLWKDFDSSGTVISAGSYKPLQPRWERLLLRCKDIATDPVKNITGENYVWLDTTCGRLALAKEYVELAEAQQSMGRTPSEESQERAQRLLDYLSQDTAKALDDARLLVQQMKEGIFREDIEKEIRDGHISIEMEPLTVYTYEPILFRIQFRRSPFNRAAALRELGCVWDFGHDGFRERGWATCHFFPVTADKKQITVTARFEDLLGSPVMDHQEKPVVVKETFKVAAIPIPVGERLKVELIRTAAVLVAATLGLLAGARTELAKADIATGIVAVFLLGFSVDALKNLLTKK